MTVSTRYTLDKIAGLLGGKLSGDPRTEICGVASFDHAGPDQITFAVQRQFLKRLDQSNAGCILIPPGVKENIPRSYITVDNPQAAFCRVMRLFFPVTHPWNTISRMARIGNHFRAGADVGIAPFAVIEDHVTVGDRTVIYPYVYIGKDTVIGDDTVIFPNVTIRENCRIGNRVVINPETVIGSEGFGFTPEEGAYVRIPQVGIVQIDDDVEIGPCNAIDRATFEKTWIKRGVKTGSHVHIAHNCTVGEHCIIVAHVAIAGSVTIGNHCVIAGKTAIAQHLTIGDHVTIGGRSSVLKSIKDGEIVSGTPQMPHKRWLKVLNLFPKLPEIYKKLNSFEKRLYSLEMRNDRANRLERTDE
jgi:UDP-3-O-[3-hydroxymyristoyl] glucosamine N-acyltransferase